MEINVLGKKPVGFNVSLSSFHLLYVTAEILLKGP